MAREFAVCDPCFRNCLLIHHGKHHLSPTVSSFFKIMFGKNFSEVLIVPPSFSKMFPSLKRKKTYLEDSNGQKWDVALSDVEGSLVIRKGWQKFSLDHDIEQGDLLVFYYIKGSHFVVQTYGKSGCLKTIPGEKNYQNKRLKTTKYSKTRNFPYDTFYEHQEPPQEDDCFGAYDVPQSDTEINLRKNDVNDVNESPVVAANVLNQENVVIESPHHLEEPFMSANRETNNAQEYDRADLLNLSAFELADLNPPSKMSSKKVEAKEDDREHLLDLHAMELPVKEPISARESDGDQLLDQSMSKTTDEEVKAKLICKLQHEGNMCSHVSKELHKTQTGDVSIDTKKRPLIQENVVIPSKKHEANLSKFECSRPPICFPSLGMPSTPIIPLKTIRKSDTFEPSASSGYSQPPGGTMRVVKQEPREFGLDFSGDENGKSNYGYGGVNVNPMEDGAKVNIIVKSEPVDFYDAADAALAPYCRITCVVPPDNESFLELPEPLPMKGKQSMRLKHKLVFLRNSAGKDWPVVYHNRYGVSVLASGWDTFRKANNIRPGDECAFVVDNIDKGIFRVQVLNS